METRAEGASGPQPGLFLLGGGRPFTPCTRPPSPAPPAPQHHSPAPPPRRGQPLNMRGETPDFGDSCAQRGKCGQNQEPSPGLDPRLWPSLGTVRFCLMHFTSLFVLLRLALLETQTHACARTRTNTCTHTQVHDALLVNDLARLPPETGCRRQSGRGVHGLRAVVTMATAATAATAAALPCHRPAQGSAGVRG